MSRPNSGGRTRSNLQPEQTHQRSDSDHRQPDKKQQQIYHQRTESEPGGAQSNYNKL